MPREVEVEEVVGSRGEEDSRGHAALRFFPPTRRRRQIHCCQDGRMQARRRGEIKERNSEEARGGSTGGAASCFSDDHRISGWASLDEDVQVSVAF